LANAWAPVVAQIGVELGDGAVHFGADAVEAGSIRRFLEPLEFDCPMHYDTDAARKAGRAGVIAPCASLPVFAAAPVWRPGESVFDRAGLDAQPARLSIKPVLPAGAPPVSSFFVVELDVSYFREVVVGERLGQKGNRLIACVPKETKVGRGAFITYERGIVDETHELVAVLRITSFVYDSRRSDE